jgi:hypothetical protein
MKYSSFTIKMINDKQQQHQADPELLADTLITNPAALPLSEPKKLLKYLHATQSQTNTPRVQIKNMQNRSNRSKTSTTITSSTIIIICKVSL